MIEKVKSRKLNIPMLEMIITLGILTIVSVFLMRLFLGANSLETKAKDISKACILAQSAAETIKAADSLEVALMELKAKSVENQGAVKVYQKYYDSKWVESTEPKTYTMNISITETVYETNTFLTADITITKEKSYPVIKKDNDPLASIRCASYKDGSSSTTLVQ